MNTRMFPIVMLLAPLASLADVPLHSLTVTVDTPLVKVAPRQAGRDFLTLPQLDYQFALQPECDAPWQPAALSLSIADSRITFDQQRVASELPMIQTRIRVPAAQLAPLPLSGFCEIAAPPDGTGSESATITSPQNGTLPLTIAAAMTVHAALICSNEQQERITYVSQPLAVTLVCALPATSELSDE